jgi:hypothetical protein
VFRDVMEMNLMRAKVELGSFALSARDSVL